MAGEGPFGWYAPFTWALHDQSPSWVELIIQGHTAATANNAAEMMI